MNENTHSKVETIAKSVEKISDSRGLEAIGNGLGAGLVALAFALGVAAFVFGIMGASRWDGQLHPQTKCFELQEIGGKTFKVNTCTGETEEFKTDNSSGS
ncbi:hypothetical protein SAMN05421690_10292 [Nitrosomonas sp. Nm51]|uniref:hypothetical protein n=1 Tax=Nitrosomonas sp. Nm51 TaxID=133720 RepID=UPI0008CC85A5|nr:hypothetical protein [Nitrosomonas sp. Nm51]SER46667.1 hypothetical protein SAMN05421690_10292 [Nitrosomonas sp. Nm51]